MKGAGVLLGGAGVRSCGYKGKKLGGAGVTQKLGDARVRSWGCRV